MRRLTGPVVLFCGCAAMSPGVARAQGRGGSDWSTAGGDAQRSSWVRTDAKISRDSMQKPGFQLAWKVKLNNEPKQLSSLTPAALLDRYIGYRGFRSLAFVGGSSDKVFALDTDLGRIEWQKSFAASTAPQGGSGFPACPSGMTANVTRPVSAAISAAPAGRGGGGGRGGPARSGVGKPDEGSVTLMEVAARGVAAGAAGRGAPAAGRGGGRTPSFLHVLSSDGMLHTMYVSNGDEPQAPLRFLLANSNAQGLIVVDNIAYAATTQGCGGAPNGVWALDLASRQVASWISSAGIAGSAGAAFGPDGTLFVATSDGDLVALEPKTLKVKDAYKAGGFTATPVVFEYKEKTLIAAAGKDGRVHLLDGAALAGPVSRTPASSNAGDFAPGALASWQDAGGTRWILAAAKDSVAAWKLVDQNGGLVLQPGWTSREIVSPLPPMVMNGVIFAVSSGELRSKPAVVYALDAATGKELWNSARTVTSFVHGGGLSAGGSQLYLGTDDGTLYAFGFPIEH